MTREDILGRIGSILDELKTECRSLYIQPHINSIELELFEANANFLKDHIAILRKLVEKETVSTTIDHPVKSAPKATSANELIATIDPKQETKTETPVKETKQEEFVAATLRLEEEPKEVKHFFSEPVKTEPEPIVSFEKPEPVAPPVEQKQEPVIIPVVSPMAEVKHQPQPELTIEEKIRKEEEAWAELNRRFQTNVPSLNDKISQNQHKTEINSVIQPAVNDLRKAVGLNDKFAFIKGLFNNSVESFEKALTDLNACNTYSEAKHLVDHQLAKHYDWHQKPELHEQFLNVVKKRFNN